MQEARKVSALLLILSFIAISYGLPAASEKGDRKQAAQKGPAKEIDVTAVVNESHPEFEEGFSCNDCHEIKVDANTAATRIWLSGESSGRAAGEGVMPKDKLWKEIVMLPAHSAGHPGN